MPNNEPNLNPNPKMRELDLSDDFESNETAVDPSIQQFASHDEPEMEVKSNEQDTTESSKKMSSSVSSGNFNSKFAFFKKHKKALFGFGGVFGLILVTLLLAAFYTFVVFSTFKVQAQEAATLGRGALDQFKNQNLPGTEESIKQLESKTQELHNTYRRLSFYKFVPIARGYYLDGEHGLNAAEAGIRAGLKTIGAVAPYADVLGFSGEESFEGGNAENRVKLILQTLEKVTPVLDEVAADLEVAQSELNQINENRYPQKIGGAEVRSQIVSAKEGMDNAATALNDFRPIIAHLPSIAGSTEGRKKYLILFQNDNELRPTGGFLTAYSVIFMEDGVIVPEKSDDIYELDKKFNKQIAIPDALGRYLTTERYFNLRDMNISPDFKTSMDQFFENYKEIRGEPGDIDGIIAVDTHLLNNLVRVVGPIEVPGYGTFTADNDPACDCPQIIHALSEIITRPTPYLREDRKGILAPLMQAILQRIYASPRVFMADLFQIGLESVNGRHLQAYFLNEEHQAATEAINAGGRLVQDEGVEDFLAIVNANLGGAKSNLYVTYDVVQTVTGPENGQITKEVEITYRNPRRADNCNLEAGLLCLNSTLRDWTRLYLPEGSQLVEAQGFTEEAKEYDEAGFHVIDGFFILEPKGQAKLKITYTVPYEGKDYKVKLWKQGGVDPIPTVIDVNGGQEEVIVDQDTVYKTEF